MFNKNKFKALLLIKGKTIDDIAELLEVSKPTVYRKMNGESDFYRFEIQKICIFLNVSDPVEIFFDNEITQT